MDVAGIKGAGDSDLDGGEATDVSWEFRREVRETPHISHVAIDGWLRNVHRGHSMYFDRPPLGSPTGRDVELSLSGTLAERFDMAAMAALVRCTSGGLMPQA